MKAILRLRRHYYLTRVSHFLIAIALIAGMAGCATIPTVNAIEIRDWYDLSAIANNMSADYVLESDLDATTEGWEELASPTANEGKGWEPIVGVDESQPWYFTGIFDGQGYEIKDLFINRPDEEFVGLFEGTSLAGVIRNVGVVNANVTGDFRVGGLVGQVSFGYVSNSYFTGTVNGNNHVGGLLGCIYNGGIMSDSYATGTVTGGNNAGGLIGFSGLGGGTVSGCQFGGTVTGYQSVGGLVGEILSSVIVENCYCDGNIIGVQQVGGLIGDNEGTVSNSYATGSVSGNETVGGLVGINWGTVSHSYSTVSVTGELHVGGLAGGNNYTVSNCYATGRVIGGAQAGGLVGTHQGGIINNSYSTGNVTGALFSVGGLVGVTLYDSSVSASFWDIETSGRSFSGGGTGKNTTEMQDIVTFLDAGWSIIGVGNSDQRNPLYTWNIVDMVTYPFLSW